MSDQAEQAEELSVADALRAARDELAEQETDDGQMDMLEAEPEPQTEEASEDVADTAEEAEPEQEAAEEGEPEPIKAPQSWSAEDARAFSDLPRPVQETIVRREREREAYLTKTSQESAPLRKLAQDWQPYFERLGTTPEMAIQALLGAERILRSGTPEQKRNTLAQLARDYAIEPQEPQPAPNGQDADPEVEAAVAPLREEVRALRAEREQERQSAQQAQFDAVEQMAENFLTETTGTGELVHPYVDDPTVFGRMKALVAAEHAAGTHMTPETLQGCYDAACWAVPDVRARILEDQRQAERRETAQKKQAEADRARKASKGLGASSGRGAHSRTKDAPTGESVGDTLRAAMAELAAAQGQ